MQKKDKFLIFITFLFLLLLVISESSQKKINWYPSYAVNHKIPYGSYIAYHEAQNIFGDNLKPVKVSPYLFLEKNSDISGTYVIYNSDIEIGKTGINSLLHWVKKGNNLLISSKSIEKVLLDSLGLKTANYFSTSVKKKIVLTLDNPGLQTNDSIIFDKTAYGTTLYPEDSIPKFNLISLGRFVSNDTLKVKLNLNKINFIDVAYGNGHIMLHTVPEVFTNYFILKDNNIGYFKGVLSYLNQKKPVYWDVSIQNGATSKGIFKYMIETPGFLWAYRLLFIGLLVYIFFEGKRRQRAIPVVKPPENQTLSFTKTIADMYIENKEHRLIALMHIKHFYDYIRSVLHIDTRLKQADLVKKIAEKTKTELALVNDLFELINYIKKSQAVSPKTVMELEELTNKIKRNKN